MQRSTKRRVAAPAIPDLLKQVSLKPSQRDYFDKIINSDITLCQGPAGTSKTFVACYASMKLYTDDKIQKIILSKPIQESGEKLGFLPGDIKEKIDPFMESYRTNLEKIIGWDNLVKLEGEGLIEFRPLAYMRGATFDNCLMVLDEAQNADFRQLMLFITRMGKNSKVLICGDVSQYDIARDKVALPKFIEMMSNINGLSTHTFGDSDIVRNKILIEITTRYDKWKANNKVNW